MQEYFDKVTMVLMDFQYIELALASYIISANKKIKEKMKDTIPFKYGPNDIQKDSLGKLVDKFSKINNNEELIKKLKNLIPRRNEVAHKSLVFPSEEKNDNIFKAILTSDLNRLHKELKEVFSVLLDEFKRLKNLN